jgi:hypothetical protein
MRGSNESEREGEGGQIPTKVGPPVAETQQQSQKGNHLAEQGKPSSILYYFGFYGLLRHVTYRNYQQNRYTHIY